MRLVRNQFAKDARKDVKKKVKYIDLKLISLMPENLAYRILSSRLGKVNVTLWNQTSTRTLQASTIETVNVGMKTKNYVGSIKYLLTSQQRLTLMRLKDDSLKVQQV